MSSQTIPMPTYGPSSRYAIPQEMICARRKVWLINCCPEYRQDRQSRQKPQQGIGSHNTPSVRRNSPDIPVQTWKSYFQKSSYISPDLESGYVGWNQEDREASVAPWIASGL